MLQTQTVEPDTFSVLKKLMAVSELGNFLLVGGTALSLQFGHRTSIDLDLFCNEKFEQDKIINALETAFGKQFEFTKVFSTVGVFCYINKIKVDLVYYPHKNISPTVSIDSIRMYSLEDMVSFHTRKYPSQQLLISIPYALTYFTDAEESDEPVSLKGQTWDGVKQIIQKKVSDYLS